MLDGSTLTLPGGPKCAFSSSPIRQPAPENLPSLVAAEKEWRNRYADRLDAYAWFANGGGTGIIDVDDAETLFQAINEHPFCPYTKVDVRPLVDAEAAARLMEATLATAAAA
jgi:muconolactone delta-isomerase